MNESRQAQVVLLDGRKLDFLIQPKLSSIDFLDMVATHYNLKEKEYFGLALIDQTGHKNWLQSDKKVLDHEFTKKPGALVFHFLIRFFIDNITYLKDKITVELFYLQARHSIFMNEIELSNEKIIDLAALVIQAQFGDYVNDESTRSSCRKVQIFPSKLLEQIPVSQCEDRVIHSHKKLLNMSRGMAIVQYMNIVENLANYGIHYYEVKDKSNVSWYLGISFKGISLYDFKDRIAPRKSFPWRQLENLYYRERKFSIEVHETKRLYESSNFKLANSSSTNTLNNLNFINSNSSNCLNSFDNSQNQTANICAISSSSGIGSTSNITTTTINSNVNTVNTIQNGSTSSASIASSGCVENLEYRHNQLFVQQCLSHETIQELSSSTSSASNSQGQNSIHPQRRSQSVSANLHAHHQQQQQQFLGNSSNNSSSNNLLLSGQQSQVKVHAWFASVAPLCKSIWLMAVSQHQFYLDRKQSKAAMLQFRSANELANELTASTVLLSNGTVAQNANALMDSNAIDALSRTNSLSSEEYLEQSRQAKQEMWQLYKTRKENLEKLLQKKKNELKEICIKEAEMTGRMPKEYPLENGEEYPIIKRKIGACYQFNQIDYQKQQQQTTNTNNSNNSNNNNKQQQQHVNNQLDTQQSLEQLTIDCEIQTKITNAALILACDPSASKAIRKQRREFYDKAREKLIRIENKLNELKTNKFTQNNNHSFNMNHNSLLNDDMVDLSASPPAPTSQSSSKKTVIIPNGHKSTPTSPVMIHRKESYRRAQLAKQQKAIGDFHNHSAMQAMMNTSTSSSQLQHSISSSHQHQHQNQHHHRRHLTPPPQATATIPKLNYNKYDHEDFDEQNSYMNMLYGSTGIDNFDTGADLHEYKSKRSHPNYTNGHNSDNEDSDCALFTNNNHNNNNENSQIGFVSHRSEKSRNRNGNSSINSSRTATSAAKIKQLPSNSNQANAAISVNNTSPNVISDNITIRSTTSSRRQLSQINQNGQNNGNAHNYSIQNQQQPNGMSNQASHLQLASYNSLERKLKQNKNTTSDSNVKHLADHNFYHVVNKNMPPQNVTQHDYHAKKILDEKNEELFKNILFNSSHERSADYYNRHKYRNNNLLMVNTNSGEENKYQSHSTPNDQAFKSQITTPTSIQSLYDSLYVNKSNPNSPKTTYNHSFNEHNSSNASSNLTSNNNNTNSTANNFSLNLSIHTAEEFTKEMFAWLQNEHRRVNNDSTVVTQSANTTAAATLV